MKPLWMKHSIAHTFYVHTRDFTIRREKERAQSYVDITDVQARTGLWLTEVAMDDSGAQLIETFLFCFVVYYSQTGNLNTLDVIE